ncbi:MAG: glycosyltransferase family 1 protein [Planctomycetota bacterium]|nr:glycosyltransferase family 1 protein [Planctomycetota bacterium]
MSASPTTSATASSPAPTRVCLFTDTLADVNGVSRFIQNVARCAHDSGRDLRVLTSTRLSIPSLSAAPLPNIINFPPIFARAMPGYPQLDLALPPALAMLRAARALRPHVIHVSTPGPVGMIGRLAARLMGVPLVGVYHTDFPAYVDHLFNDDAFTWVTRRSMSWFYRPFHSIFTRSDDYAASLETLGIPRDRMHTLRAGIDTDMFHRRHRDPSIWHRLAETAALPETCVKVIYVGRVSVEKNLPLLTRVWPKATEQLKARGIDARLIVVGDGPYRATMQRELADACFLGFRHGTQLATLYASADLFVFPSLTDTLGQVVMESQASALPVLVSDSGGPKEVVAHGRTGLVLSSADPDAWVAALVKLASDEHTRRAMGEAAFNAMQSCTIRASFEHFWNVHEACRPTT